MKKFILCLFLVGCGTSPAVMRPARVASVSCDNCAEMEAEYRIMNFLCDNDDSMEPIQRGEVCRAAHEMNEHCEYEVGH